MIDVTCAIIEHQGKILVTQRSENMRHPFKWEFPGGKVEAGESRRDCLLREIREELCIDIRIEEALPSHQTANIRLIPFRCSWQAGEIQLIEHEMYAWLAPEALSALDWAEADIPIVKDYLNMYA